MIRIGVACAKDRHETVSQIFVDHAAMFLLNRAYAHPEKFIHDLHDFRRRGRARPGRPRTHVNEHDGDFFFDAAQSRVAREDSFRCASAHVKAESLT